MPRMPSLLRGTSRRRSTRGRPGRSVVDADVRRHGGPSYAVPRGAEQLRVSPTPESAEGRPAGAPPELPTGSPSVERHVVRETVAARDLESAGRSQEPLSPRLEQRASSGARAGFCRRGRRPLASTDPPPRVRPRPGRIRRHPRPDAKRPRRRRSGPCRPRPSSAATQARSPRETSAPPAPTRLDEPGLIAGRIRRCTPVTAETTTQTSTAIRSDLARASAWHAAASARTRHSRGSRIPTRHPPSPSPRSTSPSAASRSAPSPRSHPHSAPRTGRPRTQSLDEYLAERNQRRQA